MKVAVIAVLLFGFTQQPPKAPERNGTAKSDGAKVTNQANTGNKDKQTSSESTPASGNITVVFNNQPDPQRHDGHTEIADSETSKENLQIQWLTVLFTGLLAFVGFLQLAALVVQAVVFYYTLKKIGVQAAHMKTHADHFDKLATETARQAEIASRALIAQFRPKILVRRVELEYGSLEVGGRPARIHCTIANIGGTECHITNVVGSFAYSDAPGFWGNPSLGNRLTPDAYSQNIDMALSLNFRAGEDGKITIDADQTMFDKIKFVQMRSGNNVTNPKLVGDVRIRAELHYVDGTGITRKTGFYRWLDIETMHFNPVGDEEYEYSD